MRMKLDQSYLSANESLSFRNSSAKHDYTSTSCDSETENSIEGDENNQENLDCNISNRVSKNIMTPSDDIDPKAHPQKLIKRKIGSNDEISSAEMTFRKSRKTLTPESSSAPSIVPATPSPQCNDIVSFRQPRNNSRSPNSRDFFAVLPDEIILMIFKNCSKPTLVDCACVCRRWKDIALDNDLWVRIDLSQRKISPGIMAHVLSRNPIVLRMSQTEIVAPIFTDSLASKSMETFNCKVEYLDLSMATVLPHDLELFLKTSLSLVKLSLENCEINENICREIAKNVKLTVLNLSLCTGLDDDGLQTILKNCKNLTELNIAWTCLNAAAIKSVCQFLPENILKLNISGCAKEITDTHVSTLLIRCNKLRELDLSDSTGITEISLNAICENLRNLEVLSMSRCYNIYPTHYSNLFMLSSLTHLNIFGLFSATQIEQLRKVYRISINQMKFSYIARPTVGDRRTSIWCMPTRN